MGAQILVMVDDIPDIDTKPPENVLIDDRRIHVDFSQSVAKYYWHHKKKGKFDKMKGANHKRVETANKMYDKYKDEDGKGREKKELKFESVGNEKELSEN